MSVTDDLLKNNESYASSFDKGDLPMPPAKQVAVLACMDARLNVYGMLGLSEGDAHVIRNAGGVVTDDGIRSAASSTRSRPASCARSPSARLSGSAAAWR
jgi:carbonic anhydrase